MLPNSELKRYTEKMKLIIASNVLYIKNRLKIFPIKTIKSLKKLELDETVIVNGETWKVRDLISDIILRYKKLLKETKTSEYSEIIKLFIQESRKSRNYNEIYQKYQKELTARLKENKDSLHICLENIKILEKKMKESHS